MPMSSDSVWIVIASPAQPGVAIQPDGLRRRPGPRAPRNDELSQYLPVRCKANLESPRWLLLTPWLPISCELE